ncbi:M16 family metallopeptidase [Pseudalkalibacillus berkeleyi]|uniref:Insulinase family protein n=1 Tax=Pseudalkalibacillus berkeleyi TaxID=1069813 RepID=A0ABS9GUE3_9BACL|nr:pitrilysin family protein [Pseudalkalibacillus berkeleyi]MCF6136452.1 insulinase family protein [Pseudalkalibacillus berkeleyi]
MYYEYISKAMLENCMKVIVRRTKQSRNLSVGMYVNHGSKDENNKNNGISHFIEHMAFSHENMNPNAKKMVGNLLDSGALYEAFTGKEMTRCCITSQRKYLPDIIKTLSEIVKLHNLPDERIQHERAIILQEAETYFASSKVKTELAERALWGERSLGLFVIGNQDNISRFTKEEIESRFRQFYSPSNTMIVIQGDVDPDETIGQIAEAFDFWKSEAVSNPSPLLEVSPSVLGIGNANRVNLTATFVGPSFRSRKRHAMALLSDILGEGLKSRLFVELREKRELVYSVYSYALSYGLGGYMAIDFNCSKESLEESFKVVMNIIDDIQNNGVTDEEIERARASRITSTLQIPNDAVRHLNTTGRYALYNKDFFVDTEVFDLMSVTKEEVREIAREMCDQSNMALSALGTDSESLVTLL